jgi:hypothetical protein
MIVAVRFVVSRSAPWTVGILHCRAPINPHRMAVLHVDGHLNVCTAMLAAGLRNYNTVKAYAGYTLRACMGIKI